MAKRWTDAMLRRKWGRYAGRTDFVWSYSKNRPVHRGPEHILEVSRRLDDRLANAEDEMRRIIALIGRKSWPFNFARLHQPLLAALSQIKEARASYVVPLIQARGLP